MVFLKICYLTNLKYLEQRILFYTSFCTTLLIESTSILKYEPELFPGLIYRMKQPKIVLLIFVSGKIVLTGAKVRDETYTAFENIYPVLTEFRKNQQ